MLAQLRLPHSVFSLGHLRFHRQLPPTLLRSRHSSPRWSASSSLQPRPDSPSAIPSTTPGESGPAMALTAEELQERIQAARRAVRLACRLCQAVQKKLAQGESAAKEDKSPVTVADYGAQALVSWALMKEQPAGQPFSMVAEEDSSDFGSDAGKAMLSRIKELVNETLLAEHRDSTGASSEVGAQQLSEEEVVHLIDKGASPGGAVGQHWVLDPIDGTKGFMRGDQYAVALGLLDEGQVVLGVLGCPNLPMASIAQGVDAARTSGEPVGCVFSAVKGTGTTVEALDGSVPPKKVHVSTVTDPALATFCESYESAHSLHSLTAGITQVLGVTAPPVRIDSQAKYGAMARGDAAIYLRFPHAGYREKIWDHAAGSIVITEAGGVVSDAAGAPLDFSKGRYLDLDTGIMATNASLYPVLLDSVQTVLKKEQSAPPA